VTLRALRESRGLTLEQVGQRVGMSKGYVSLYETGQRAPSPQVANKLAQALHVDPEGLAEAVAAAQAAAAGVHGPKPAGAPQCGPCGRRLDAKSRKAGARARLLAEPDYCRFCARPQTEAALELAPLAGFVALVRTMAREPASVRSHRVAEVDA
jgi:DNA-binding XRE family transcriptional regulator